MTFEEIIRSGEAILTEGAVVERLNRDPSVTLDPHILHADFIGNAETREPLASIYRGYIDIAADHGLPMAVGAPTWRANPERVRLAGPRTCEDVNREAVQFLREIRSGYGPFGERVWIGGLMACRGDAYDPTDHLSADEAAEFHEEQAAALAAAGVDFLLAATLPSAEEATGLARAMGRFGIPYVLSFVLRPTGILLDGTPFREVVAAIDGDVNPPPLCYWANCVHPTVFTSAMYYLIQMSPDLRDRVVGLQANTSPLAPEDLDDASVLETMDPATFGEQMGFIHTAIGTRVLGGCCGTNTDHIRAIADAIGSV